MAFLIRPLLCAAIAALSVSAGSAQAAAGTATPGHQVERLVYSLQFGGLRVADVLVTLDETANTYRTEIKLRSRGLADMFKTFSADMSGEGALVRNDDTLATQPAAFRREWATGEINSALKIVYDPGTRLATAEERIYNPLTGEDKKDGDMPWNKKSKALKPVPADMRTSVLDPMAAFVAARAMIRDKAGPASFSVPIYDGRRRYNVVGKTSAPKDVTINDVTRSVIAVSGRVEPVFGFDPQMEDKIHEGEGKIMFSADDRFIPVQIMVGNSLGVGVMNLSADCHTDPAPCDAFGQDQAQAAN